MRVLVCGGREFDDWKKLDQTLTIHTEKDHQLNREVVIIQGGANGADFLAKVWAKYKDLNYEEYKANWKHHGKSAGAIRNARMLEEGKPDLVIAFPGSNGTKDMINKATRANIKVIIIK